MGRYQRGERFREWGFTLVDGRALEDLGVQTDELHRVFEFDGQRTPLVLALRRSESYLKAYRAFKEARTEEENTYREVFIAGEMHKLEEARKAAEMRRNELAIPADVVGADVYDELCAPVAWVHASGIRIFIDHDLQEYRIAGLGLPTVAVKAETLVREYLEEGGGEREVIELARVLQTDEDAVSDMLEEIHQRHNLWSAARDALIVHSHEEARGILQARARASVDARQLALLPRPRIIALDFDGTVFAGKFTAPDVVEGPAKPGAIAWIKEQLAAGVVIWIHTCRLTSAYPGSPFPADGHRDPAHVVAAISGWLCEHGLTAAEVAKLQWWTHPGKPAADVYLDDKGQHFAGVFPQYTGGV